MLSLYKQSLANFCLFKIDNRNPRKVVKHVQTDIKTSLNVSLDISLNILHFFLYCFCC